MQRFELSDEIIDAGDAASETRGLSVPGKPDTDRPLNFDIGLSDQD